MHAWVQFGWQLWDTASVALCIYHLLRLVRVAEDVYHCCQCRETAATRVVTTGITGLCLLLNELDVKRSRQWSQGYSINEVSSGK